MNKPMISIRVLLSLILAYWLPSTAFSQHALIEKGVSEAYLGGAVGFGNHISASTGELGISLDGRLGLSLTYSSFASKDNGTADLFSPVATFAFHSSDARQPGVMGIRVGLVFAEDVTLFDAGTAFLITPSVTQNIIFTLGGGTDLLLPASGPEGSVPQFVYGITSGARIGLSRHFYCFVIPAASFARGVTTFSIGAGLGIKGNFSPKNKPRKSEASRTRQ